MFDRFFGQIKNLFRRITAAVTSISTTLLGLTGSFDSFFKLNDSLPPLAATFQLFDQKPEILERLRTRTQVVIVEDVLDLFDQWRTDELKKHFEESMEKTLKIVAEFSARVNEIGKPPSAGGSAETLDQDLTGQTTFIANYGVFTSDMITEISNGFVNLFTIEPLATSANNLRTAMAAKALQQNNKRTRLPDADPRVRIGALHQPT